MALVPPRGKPNEGDAAMGTKGVGFLSVKDNETALGGAVVGLGFVRLVQSSSSRGSSTLFRRLA